MYHHGIMPRTTVNIDAPVLRDLKRRQKRDRKSLGQVVSELLARAMADDRRPRARPEFNWIAKPLGLKVDLLDKDALWAALDAEDKNERLP